MANIRRVNHLTENFYLLPQSTKMTMTLREWQETSLYTEGEIMACGSLWDLVGKRLAPGVYRVSLTKRI